MLRRLNTVALLLPVAIYMPSSGYLQAQEEREYMGGMLVEIGNGINQSLLVMNLQMFVLYGS